MNSGQDIKTVLVSHAHFDHVGNARRFPEATWYLQRREYEAMFGPHFEHYGSVPALSELQVRCKRKFRTTHSKHRHPVAENLLSRDFTAARPNQ